MAEIRGRELSEREDWEESRGQVGRSCGVDQGA